MSLSYWPPDAVCLYSCVFSLTFSVFCCFTGEEGGAESIVRIEKFLDTSVEFHELDLLDKSGLEKLFEKVIRILFIYLFLTRVQHSINCVHYAFGFSYIFLSFSEQELH